MLKELRHSTWLQTLPTEQDRKPPKIRPKTGGKETTKPLVISILQNDKALCKITSMQNLTTASLFYGLLSLLFYFYYSIFITIIITTCCLQGAQGLAAPHSEHPRCPGLRWLHLPRTTPHRILAKASQLGTDQQGSFQSQITRRGKTHALEFYRRQPASSDSSSLQCCGPELFLRENKKGPRRGPGRGVTPRPNEGPFQGSQL